MANPVDPQHWLEHYGDDLYRYAYARTGHVQVAEDLVQETLLAAIEARERFAHKSSEKTWLTGILKHKVLDHFRRHYQTTRLESFDAIADELEKLYFDDREHWQYTPTGWSSQETSLRDRDFWNTFHGCLDTLPDHMVQLFFLREDGLSSKQLCKIFNISTTNNVWVILSRTRMRLRHCLETRWFNDVENNRK